MVCIIIFASCSKEELYNNDTETIIESNLESRASSEVVTSKIGENELTISNILPETAEYVQQLKVLSAEGARTKKGVNAIKTVDLSGNTTYYFKSKYGVTFGVLYTEENFIGIFRIEEGFREDGKPSLVLSNLKEDRKVDVRDNEDVAAKFSGSYSACVSDSVEFAYDGCGGGFWGYVCGVPWSMGSVVYCVGESAACYFFC